MPIYKGQDKEDNHLTYTNFTFHLNGNFPTEIPQNQKAIPTIKIKSNTSPFVV